MLFVLPFIRIRCSSWIHCYQAALLNTTRSDTSGRRYKMTEREIRKLPVLVNAKTAAQVLNVSTRHVTNMCARGELKAVKCGRVWRVNLADLVRRAGLVGESAE